jgi:dihydroxyacetone kinase
MSCFSCCNSLSSTIILHSMSSISVSQLKSLNICWNNVFRKIFRHNKWESVKLVIEGLGLLNLTHLYYLSVIKLIKTMLNSGNLVVRNIASIFVKATNGMHSLLIVVFQ